MFPCQDLRQFIAELEKQEELKRVATEVDWNLELPAIVRKLLDQQGPAVSFQNIKGYSREHSFFTGTLGTLSRYALALGLPKDTAVKEITRTYRERSKKLIRPVIISRDGAPCKENIQLEKEVELFKFPTPFWHARDGGRYLGTFHCVITKDPDSGWVNVGLYRLMIHDRNHLGIFMGPYQHANLMYKRYEEMRKAMPIAISIGQDPINVIAAFAPLEASVCEWDFAGALRTQPVELVKCETVDLEVPRTAEIVIEGEVPPLERREEGTFGEYTGYYAGTREPRPFIKVNCITHRNNPIHTGLLEGKPPQENTLMSSIHFTALLERMLIDELKLGIKAVYAHPWAVGHGVVVAFRPLYPGHVSRVAEAIWSSKVGSILDYVIAVDEDIDPCDLNQVLWAITTRCKPDRDILIRPRARASPLWPCLDPEGRAKSLGCKVILDATFPAEWPREWIPAVSDWWDYPTEIRKKVEDSWQTYGIT